MANNSQTSGFSSAFTDNPRESVITGFTDVNICGEGASCIVYGMRLGGLRVAVKRLRPRYRECPQYVASYRKEYQIGSRLKHDGLPIYRGLLDNPDEVYLIMDFVDGVTLADFIRSPEGKAYFCSMANVRRFLSQLLDIVAYLHRSGVVHCDIKPANIMLRHSDRGVMLIDLDKSYCDILDRTHGGTAGISDILDGGKKPTVDKDFAAIGNVLDCMAESVAGFPKRTFRRFRKECQSGTTSDDSMREALAARPDKRGWIAGIASLCLISGIAYYAIRSTVKETVSVAESVAESREEAVVVDSVAASADEDPVVPEVPPIVAAGPSMPKKTVSIAEDLDVRMEDVILELDDALSTLSSGNIPNDRIQEMIYDMMGKYTGKYQEILTEYKAEHPDMSGLDVELEVARKSERSRSSALWQRFMRAATDTIVARRPPDPFLDEL